ncbi:UDP-N-acetylglucosamine 4,6-dehydratase (inverting) [Thalassospira xiamenensis]|uniref:UDP-N-acetylglucosamine 4,6-dehydratase (inverting) n=1 Tax=Thalassospira xiamenensis TaxID=220697 RepID=UPI000DED63BF|nr:UDP-N-acetylglucosamine 4,6-dehydratase (inverting) [Thalassospira xiamenensis]
MTANLAKQNAVDINDASILITGGTGSFGRAFIKSLFARYKPRRVVVFSRDELKQFEMAQEFPEVDYPIRYFIGDVRDSNRLMRACHGIDIVVHAAAMKHVTAAEYNPTECIATNIDGAQNLVEAAIDNNVKRVVALSTDKAANPINLYGATKLCSDKLFVAGNNLSGKSHTRFSVVRYGNVAGSRGSVIPFFKKLADSGVTDFPITHEEMTRFIIRLDEGVELVIKAISSMYGGEIFVPKLPSIKVKDLPSLITPNGTYHVIGVRPGEKLHEVMIPSEEARNSVDLGSYYIIQPAQSWWNVKDFRLAMTELGEKVSEDFEYASNTNDHWMTQDELKQLVEEV